MTFVILNYFKMCGPEVAWSTPGTIRVDLPDLPLKYGPDTTCRSEVIEFKVIDFFGEKLGNSLPLSPPLVVYSNRKNATAPAQRNPVEMICHTNFFRLSSISHRK